MLGESVPCGVCQRTLELSREVYRTSDAGSWFPHSVNILFDVDGFVVTEGWKMGFNESKLMETIAWLVCNHSDFQVRFHPLTNHWFSRNKEATASALLSFVLVRHFSQQNLGDRQRGFGLLVVRVWSYQRGIPLLRRKYEPLLGSRFNHQLQATLRAPLMSFGRMCQTFLFCSWQ